MSSTNARPILRPAALLATLALAAATPALAQVQLVSRHSEVNAGWLAGYGPDIYAGGAADEDDNLMAADGMRLQGSDSATDSYLSVFWTATVAWDLSHRYDLEAAPGASSAIASARLISAAGSSSALSAVNSPASSDVRANLPGNLLSLGFWNPVQQDFLFQGDTTRNGAANRNTALVVVRNELGGAVATSLEGGWNQRITLPAGLYRIDASAITAATGNESAGSAWNYRFEAVGVVPEPAPAALWGAGLAALAGLARRRAGRAQAATAFSR